MAYETITIDQVDYNMRLVKVVDEKTVLTVYISASPTTDDDTGELMIEEGDQAFQTLVDFINTSAEFQVVSTYRRSSGIRAVTETPPEQPAE